MQPQTLMWIIFNAVVALLLYIDLGILNRHSHEVSLKEASLWVMGWISLALLFCGGIWHELGRIKAMEFLTGYIIEYSLSLDNLFVFVMIFSYFGIPRKHHPRILRWGILGAVVMRFVFIFAGISLVNTMHWLFYLFGALLIYTGIKMAGTDGQKVEPEKNPLLKLFKKLMPFENTMTGDSFFIKKGQVWHATPLFATLLVVEASDVMFAFDSIPAILAISRDKFIVYTSNVFAIMGLRALYFLLSGTMKYFRFLKYGISVILCYVGAKMMLMDIFHIPVTVSLALVIGILALSIMSSVIITGKHDPAV
ncbi:MAG: TerC family protein [bacterium]